MFLEGGVGSAHFVSERQTIYFYHFSYGTKKVQKIPTTIHEFFVQFQQFLFNAFLKRHISLSTLDSSINI